MTKYGIRCVALLSILFVVGQGVALAEMLEGRVARASDRALDLIVYDANGRPYPNTLSLRVGRNTRISGVATAAALRPNDAVGVTVHQEESRAWVADQITRYQEVAAPLATQKPSPSLRDVLGNPVAKGALTGAASGALASGMSGGKAGKGALIGAGVGAAAGLLEGLFSQPASNRSQGYDSNENQ